MVQSRNDPAVEQKRILMFMQELQKVRHHDDNVGLCTFPAVMGHTYLTPNYAKHFPGGPRDNWWAPYAMDALVRYLTEGRTQDSNNIHFVSCLLGCSMPEHA